jgi:signal transduction histidine kinase
MTDAGDSREVLALRNLHDVITTVHSGQDLADVLQTAAQGVVEVLGFEVAVVDCVDDDGFVEALAVAGDPDACRTMKGRRIPLTDILEEFDIADEWGRLRFVPHDRLQPDAEASWVPDLVPLDTPDAWHPLDALYAPLHGPTGELLGVLHVDLPVDRRRPTPLGRQVLEMYAVQAGLAIHHAQERARLNERVRLGSAVRAVVETATHELDLAAVMVNSFEPLAAGFRCDRVVLQVWPDPGEDRVDASATALTAVHPPPAAGDLTPWPEHGQRALQMLDVGDRVASRCWEKSRTAVLDPLEEPGDDLVTADDLAAVRDFMAAVHLNSAMLVPLGSGPQCLGHVILLREESSGAWTEGESDAALEVGREIGRAVHRAHLYARERELVAELQELDRSKGEMINTITHELKNPLTSIHGYVELLSEGGVAPREVAAIERNVRRLVTLIDDLLLLAKVSDPNREFVPGQVDLAAVVDEVCDALAVQADRKGVRIDRTRVQRLQAWGERAELTRMLLNIVSNAVKYTPAGGCATLEVQAAGPRVVFSCTDTGLGISAEDRVKLFDEFERSSNPEARAEPGSGLGLTIVRRIAERHGAHLALESEVGAGSTFRVELLPG